MAVIKMSKSVCGKFNLCIILLISVITTILCDQYNNKIKDKEPDQRPFRMQKCNQLWEKAKKRFGDHPKRMADLYADLKVHDKQRGSHKKQKANGLDEDGMKEAQLEKKFVELMQKHKLISTLDQQYQEELDNETARKRGTFTDKKLNKLWNKAQLAGFSPEELELLQEEFFHQQSKLNHYHELRGEIESQKNIIDPEGDGGLDAQSNKVQETDLKAIHRELKDNYKRLEGLSERTKDKENEFSDDRVYQLWALAKSANMTQEELDSLKDELRHFENRIEKHEFFERQVEISKDSLDLAASDSVIPDKHLDLEKKAADYKHKVKKLHNNLKKKINEAVERRTEL